jgi:hypothetical protein
MVTRILVRLLTLALVIPTAAAAQGPATLAPPGNSGVSQYLEVVPTDNGSRPSSSQGPAGGGLTPSQRRTLDGLGPSGRTLAAVVAATSPEPASGGHSSAVAQPRSADTGTSRPATQPAAAPSASGVRSPLSSIASAAVGSGGGGMGWLLPAVLVVTTLAFVVRGFVVWRRGRTS